jgi:hypothetical protein
LEVAAEIVLLCLPLARSGGLAEGGYLIICHLKVTPFEATFRI